ncbi:6-phosphogluconolactonase [Kordiimonas marina]|uniref:6-phosphogluconolactonase n=1 Tax=Kordiimonas marina TaxID=2872312 RepID=UPI001FF4F6D8|nr:6-phosphogluconolactonase [Kordiimonas marina]MCJ9430685.1 6-phosphogluconolactonase [Kordiimonas marina]
MTTAWHCYDRRDMMVAALRDATVAKLRESLTKYGRAAWAVSGGSTPAPLFEAMSAVPLDWAHVDVALVDERWVGTDHPRSNEAFVRGCLKKNKAKDARIIGMKTPHEHAAEAAATVNARYALIPRAFDSVLLGLGPDGHTASLFPGAEGLEKAFDMKGKRTCAALKAIKSDVTGDEVERMSLTAPAIACAHHVALMITGEDKKKVLQEALSTKRDLPVARLAEVVDIDIYWAP